MAKSDKKKIEGAMSQLLFLEQQLGKFHAAIEDIKAEFYEGIEGAEIEIGGDEKVKPSMPVDEVIDGDLEEEE
tara:strand:+ start:541 stop:759 length:219 start_codon:yes stop_codon:yes gene_type:complete